jgi:hypothetical protein
LTGRGEPSFRPYRLSSMRQRQIVSAANPASCQVIKR